MKVLVELFCWGVEGSYQQIFFPMDNELSDQQMIKVIEKEVKKNVKKNGCGGYYIDFYNIFKEQQVFVNFGYYQYITHLDDSFILNDWSIRKKSDVKVSIAPWTRKEVVSQ